MTRKTSKIEPAIHGEDLLRREEKLAALEKARDELRQKKTLFVSRKKARLEELSRQCENVGWRVVEAKEHVYANPVSSENYRRLKKEKLEREAQERAAADREQAKRQERKSLLQKIRDARAEKKKKPRSGIADGMSGGAADGR